MEPEVEMTVFDCEQGDTILLRLPGAVWALIDCHLPLGPVRERFFRLIQDRGIERLDILCLTHPHEDHYHGMAEVVKYFTSEGRTLGLFCDSGVGPRDILDLLRAKRAPKPYISEYERLQVLLSNLINQGRIRYFRGNQDSLPIFHRGSVYLQPIGPRSDVARDLTRAYLSRGGPEPKLKEDMNRLSLILVLQVQGRTRTLNNLFAGDADGQGINSALQMLCERDGGATRQFDVVKVPHHASADSNTGSLLSDSERRREPGLAIVCVGHSYDVLPDRNVLADFLRQGWRVLSTTKRLATSPRARQRPLELASARTASPHQTVGQSLSIQWSDAIGLAWSPVGAEVNNDELHFYQASGDPRRVDPLS